MLIRLIVSLQLIYCICNEHTLLLDVDKGGESYEEALDVAKENLPSTHPIRLGLALNYSVFYYEIKNERDKASELAKKVSHLIITGDF